GSTQTHALLLGSPAIDRGNNSLAVGPDGALIRDQRGLHRTVDGIGQDPIGDYVDIGAFEFSLLIATGADFDGNGFDDYATYDSRDGKLIAFLGTQQQVAQIATGDLDKNFYWESFRVGDFNGDGRDDLAFKRSGTNEWRLALSDGSRFFVQSTN